VFTPAELRRLPLPSEPADEWSLADRFRASFDPERSGDLIVAPKPHITPIIDVSTYVATHGSPWNYDRKVPILFYRPGVVGFEQSLPVETVDILPTLAALIELPVPSAEVDGRCINFGAAMADSCAFERHSGDLQESADALRARRFAIDPGSHPLVASSMRSMSLRPQERLDRAALIHRAVTLGDLVERQGEIEDLAGVDLAVAHQVDQLGQEAAYGGGTAVQVDMGEEQLLTLELNPMRDSNIAYVASRARGMDRLHH